MIEMILKKTSQINYFQLQVVLGSPPYPAPQGYGILLPKEIIDLRRLPPGFLQKSFLKWLNDQDMDGNIAPRTRNGARSLNRPREVPLTSTNPGTSNNPSCQLPPDYTYDNVAGYAYKFAGSNHNEAWAVCIKETGMMHGYEQGPDFALTPTISAILGFDNDSGLDQTNYFCALDCP